MLADEKIIELFFERSEQGIRELDNKYGEIQQYFYLTQDPETGIWTIVDNTSPEPSPSS